MKKSLKELDLSHPEILNNSMINDKIKKITKKKKNQMLRGNKLQGLV